MSFRNPSAAAVFSAFLFSTAAFAGPITVSDGWFRALPGGLPAGGYFKLHNAGSKAIILTGAQSPACGMLMLHMSMHGSGMDHMMAIDKIDVAGGDKLEFAPGGYHLMCMNPTPMMRPGASVPVSLRFADGTVIATTFAVKNATGK